MSWTRRQAVLWDIAQRCLTPKEYARTTMLALRPIDLENRTGEKFDPDASGRRCKSAYAPPVEVLTFKPQIGALKRRAGTARRKLSHLKPV
jgi:hypothetical protein